MTEVPSRCGATRAVLVCAVLAAPACANRHLKLGQAHLGRGDLVIAAEYFAAGMEGKETPDPELQSALIEAHAIRRMQLDAERGRLVELGRYDAALSKLLWAAEGDQLALASKLPAPPVSGESLGEEHAGLLVKAIEQVSADLDRRETRGELLKDDLARCRQLSSYDGAPEEVAARCERIRQEFKLYARLEAESAGFIDARRLASSVTTQVGRQKLELFELVGPEHTGVNARLRLSLARPAVADTGWFVARHEAYHIWVPRLDEKGNQIYRTNVIYPTQAEIDAAKERKQPPPEPREEKKGVYDRVAGQYIHYEAHRTVSVGYNFELHDLRAQRLIRSWSGVVEAKAVSKYHNYKGDERARTIGFDRGPDRRQDATPLPEPMPLIEPTLAALMNQFGTDLIATVE